MENAYSHLVEYDEAGRKILIYRVYQDGKKVLYTSTDFPEISAQKDLDKYKEFAERLGENLLVDSELSRKLLGLN